jgi:hypothetical protein
MTQHHNPDLDSQGVRCFPPPCLLQFVRLWRSLTSKDLRKLKYHSCFWYCNLIWIEDSSRKIYADKLIYLQYCEMMFYRRFIDCSVKMVLLSPCGVISGSEWRNPASCRRVIVNILNKKPTGCVYQLLGWVGCTELHHKIPPCYKVLHTATGLNYGLCEHKRTSRFH